MTDIIQIPGQLPAGYTLDSLLTPSQFACWRQEPESTIRKRLAAMPGVIIESRKCIRIHPRTYLELRLRKTVN